MKKLLLALVVVMALPSTVFAENDIKNEIIERCRSQMGQYGASLVKSCVDQDIAAVNAISRYPDEHRQIARRCMSQMRKYGFSLVKSCIDQDIAAEKSLNDY